jgi:molecular chaperone GrpE
VANKKKNRKKEQKDNDSYGEPQKIVVPSDEEINEILNGEKSEKPVGPQEPGKREFSWPMEEEAAYALFEKAGERDTYLNELKKAKADLINYQNRVKKDREQWSKQAVRNLCLALLTTLDNFDLAMKHAEDNPEDTEGLLEGIKMTHASLVSALESFGVRPIEALGEPFDPNFHEAVFTEPAPEHTESMVLGELRKGYMIDDWVLRATKVKVSQPTPDDAADEADDTGG